MRTTVGVPVACWTPHLAHEELVIAKAEIIMLSHSTAQRSEVSALHMLREKDNVWSPCSKYRGNAWTIPELYLETKPCQRTPFFWMHHIFQDRTGDSMPSNSHPSELHFLNCHQYYIWVVRVTIHGLWSSKHWTDIPIIHARFPAEILLLLCIHGQYFLFPKSPEVHDRHMSNSEPMGFSLTPLNAFLSPRCNVPRLSIGGESRHLDKWTAHLQTCPPPRPSGNYSIFF